MKMILILFVLNFLIMVKGIEPDWKDKLRIGKG